MPLTDLVNKGCIVHHPSGPPGRSFIVTGLHRSGTSLVASVLQRAGLFMGRAINDIVYEDEEIAQPLTTHDRAALIALVARRNAEFPCWGFKFPMLCQALQPAGLALFERPRVIVTFRDPVAMAVRTALSEFRDTAQALREVVDEQAAMLGFVQALACPALLLSYEKMLAFPGDFIDSLAQFCDLPLPGDLRARLVELVEPNRQRYLAGARRRYEGLIEGVRGGLLYGWCRLTQSAEPLLLDIVVDDIVVSRLAADLFRQDLLDGGIGTGRHGFALAVDALRARPDSVIRVRIAPHGVELDNSGTRLCDFGTAAA
ncbi:MAG: hypothetical protein WDN25_02250 [Acetobacteraceae bacterium]